MIDKFCKFLLTKMRNKMPEIDDERAEIILYGIQLILGEIPKIVILFAIGFLLKIGWYTIFTYIALMPYRAASGGFHLKSHLGCILGSSIFYYGVVYLSKFLILDSIQKYIFASIILVFGIIMVTLYAPADTENIPIISQKERKQKKILSYITLIATLIAGSLITNNIISNILIIGIFIQTIMITKIAYKLTNNKYGYQVYQEQMKTIN